MATDISRESYQFLQREALRWQEDELLSVGQCASILRQYQPLETGGRIVGILTTIGAILVGLGVLLFIGAKWQKLAACGKIAIIGCSIVSCYSAGWYLKFVNGSRPRVGDALFLLGCLLYGGGIWLIAQIFHLETNFNTGMLLWNIGVIPVALVANARMVAILASILFAVWLNHQSTSIVDAILPFAGTMFAVYFTRSRWALLIALAALGIWAVGQGMIGITSAVLFGSASFLGYLWHKNSMSWGGLDKPYLYVAAIASFGGWLMVAQSEVLFHLQDGVSGSNGPVNLVAVMTALVVGLIFLVKFRHTLRWELAAVGVSLVVLLIAMYLPPIAVSVVAVNLFVVALLFAALLYAINVLESPGITAVTLVFFVIDIVSRYFDFYFKMLDRSLFFCFGGIILLAVGYALERRRRKVRVAAV